VVLLLVDGTEPLSEPDKKLAQYVAEQYKPVVLVVNKWDLAREKVHELHNDEKDVPGDTELMEQFRVYLDAELPHVDFAPIAFVTAKDGKNIQSVLDLAQHLFKQANIRLGTGPLNRAVRQILEERTPPTPGGRRARVYYATQIDVAPPTIVLFVNNPEFIDETYQRYMINRFRELLPYDEVPIRLVVRPRSERGAGADVEDGTDEDHAKPPVPRRPKPAKAAAARPRPHRAADRKPHPKSTTRKGPRRGTRPR
jgi:GTP-binding protein